MEKIKENKLIILIALVIIIAVVIVYLSMPSEDKEFDEEIKYPEISKFVTASNILNLQEYTQESSFNASDKVWIYQRFTNLAVVDGSIDIYVNLSVTFNNTEYYAHEINVTTIEKGRFWYFYPTSWPAGTYTATSYLIDRNADVTDIAETTFFIN